ncbi:MAG: hypothetical protein AB1611_09790 [bacterium]
MKNEYSPIIIVAALYAEIQGLISNLKRISSWLWEGEYAGHLVRVVKTGVGRAMVQKNLGKALLDAHRGCLVINIGWAGALQPHLKVGSIVAAREIVEVSGSRNGVGRDLSLLPDSPPLAALSAGGMIAQGTLLTVSQVANVEEKQDLRQRYPQALALDMESFPVAELCQKRQLPVMILRAISDTLHFRLPDQLGKETITEDHTRLYRACQQAAKANLEALSFFLKQYIH